MVTTLLRERMRQAMRIRNLSPRTEQIYLHSVARFAQHFRRSPDRSCPDDAAVRALDDPARRTDSW